MTSGSLLGNGVALRSMFREIIRGLRKARDKAPVLEHDPLSSFIEFEREVAKASIDQLRYRDYLLSEIRHTAIQKFSLEPKHIKDHAWYTHLLKGWTLVETLDAINSQPSNASSWKHLIEIVIEERTSQLRKSRWTLDNEAHKQEIEEGRLKELHPLQAKRILSRRKKPVHNIDPTTDRGFKAKLAESKDNASWVVRNYLKRLQLTGKIPNPYKLPYVSNGMHQQALQLPKALNIIPGSTRTVVLESAYDMAHIESIIKPEIEYLLNKRHHLEAYQRIVNKKGPVKVQIRSTLAGVMQAHFLRSSVKDTRRMKELAMDVKKLTRAVRKQFIWNLDSSQAEILSERKIGDGYAVRGSKGFSMDEVMYPRKYHEALVSEEAEWEFLIKTEELKAKFGSKALHDARVASQLGSFQKLIAQSWLDPLDCASKAIDAEIELYFAKYKITEHSPIWKRKDALQARMNNNYETTSRKFGQLVRLIGKNRVCTHSDLFHRRQVPYRHSKGKQMPEKERMNMGKSLGDYLEEAGLTGYKMGYEFKKRLNIA